MGLVVNLLRNQLIPALQQRVCVDSTIFVQDGAPPYIVTPVKQLLNLHFENYRIISRHFQTAWPPRLPDLNPCDFWLWGYLKDVVYGVRLRNTFTISPLKHSDLLWNMRFALSAHRRKSWTAY
ncbi:hypothetical protein AVEN_240408-1 [Araneus ventricosus]|uniref:Tc1-like transposase DDE domain-containing protein n=1 Tax=Araneus ventricosus TaxID=182803 RepID=A0A4Y2GYU1_ARAVE|nr:hypothetical protein AVEN_240408-1 [Araneus ventricosus]